MIQRPVQLGMDGKCSDSQEITKRCQLRAVLWHGSAWCSIKIHWSSSAQTPSFRVWSCSSQKSFLSINTGGLERLVFGMYGSSSRLPFRSSKQRSPPWQSAIALRSHQRCPQHRARCSDSPEQRARRSRGRRPDSFRELHGGFKRCFVFFFLPGEQVYYGTIVKCWYILYILYKCHTQLLKMIHSKSPMGDVYMWWFKMQFGLVLTDSSKSQQTWLHLPKGLVHTEVISSCHRKNFTFLSCEVVPYKYIYIYIYIYIYRFLKPTMSHKYPWLLTWSFPHWYRPMRYNVVPAS